MTVESILTDGQIRELKENARFRDVTGVLAFVAEIDANNSNPRRRCIGRRLYAFLAVTQQFSDIVGVFVSSHPETAALVWGGVKMAILAVSKEDTWKLRGKLSLKPSGDSRETESRHTGAC